MTEPPDRKPLKPDYQSPPRPQLNYARRDTRARWSVGWVLLIVLLALLGAAILLLGACWLSFR